MKLTTAPMLVCRRKRSSDELRQETLFSWRGISADLRRAVCTHLTESASFLYRLQEGADLQREEIRAPSDGNGPSRRDQDPGSSDETWDQRVVCVAKTGSSWCNRAYVCSIESEAMRLLRVYRRSPPDTSTNILEAPIHSTSQRKTTEWQFLDTRFRTDQKTLVRQRRSRARRTLYPSHVG
jgi:hypothetical protein